MQKILVLVGTRPNFIKITQFKTEAKKHNFDLRIVHSGQHYDHEMSQIFFAQFNLKPDYFLDIPKGKTSTEQIANTILKLGQLVQNEFRPDLFLVVGDVNSTLAGALFAHKNGIRLGHIESGLRSNDLGMPEEINRILVDKITDYYFVTEISGYDNLLAEGVNKDKVFFVGNTMIDTLISFDQQIDDVSILEEQQLEAGKYILITMHRPATVDIQGELKKMVNIIKQIATNNKVVFPVHPRTKANLVKFNLYDELSHKHILLLPPLGYFQFQKLIKNAERILTDSGGIQEETTYRQIPCFTLRNNTERPSTITTGSNTLIPIENGLSNEIVKKVLSKPIKDYSIPKFWDGKSTERIFTILNKKLNEDFISSS